VIRRGLILLAACAGLAALFVTASRSPGPRYTLRVTSTGFVVNLSCTPTPLGIDCATHTQAERLRARFARSHFSVAVKGKTVVLPLAIPRPTEPSASVP
jgi:hypothetical protein